MCRSHSQGSEPSSKLSNSRSKQVIGAYILNSQNIAYHHNDYEDYAMNNNLDIKIQSQRFSCPNTAT